MSELITKFLEWMEKLCKEDPFVFLIIFLISFSLNAFFLVKAFRKAKRKKKPNSEKLKQSEVNKTLIDKAKIEERLKNFTSQLRASKNQVAKLEVKIDEASEENSYLREKNAELEADLRKQKIEELKKKIKELQKTSRKNKN